MINFERGEKIDSLDELIDQDFIIFKDKVYHSGWIISWQLRYAKLCLLEGCYKAVRK